MAGQTANRRMLALNGRFETGGFYSGTRRQTVAGLTVRARPGYIISFNGEWNAVDLAEGQFTSNVFRVIADSQFTPFMAIVNNIQYDTVSRVMGWQSRYRWIMKPGNDLYLVYTHNWLDDPWPADSSHSTGSSPLKCCIHTGSRHDPEGRPVGYAGSADLSGPRRHPVPRAVDQVGQVDESGARCLSSRHPHTSDRVLVLGKSPGPVPGWRSTPPAGRHFPQARSARLRLERLSAS